MLLLALLTLAALPRDARATTYYVRQTVGDDAHDGTSPETAWSHIQKLSRAMYAGDTAYVGPGLYREEIDVSNDGTPDKRITFIADTTGQHTGDPPGAVLITGAEPVDESSFVPHGVPGVYTAPFPYPVLGLVEMDGDQSRYLRVTITKEFHVDKMSPVDIVAKFPSSFYWDDNAGVLYLHTSDGKPPSTHEIELIRRGNGILMVGKHHVTAIGFAFRHEGDAGINFFEGSGNGIAINNTVWGSRQGIRVYTATNILVYGNTLFRNENCGVYFAAQSAGGSAIGNIAYDNIKGLRWGSKSVDGLATDNVLFDNRECGLSIEETNRVVVRGNRLAGNLRSQLLVVPPSEIDSESNCFANDGPEQLTADFFYTDHYKTLADYQREKHQDLDSRDNGCGPLPAKLDVHKLHAETMAYAELARRTLSGAVEIPGKGTKGAQAEGASLLCRWYKRLLGR